MINRTNKITINIYGDIDNQIAVNRVSLVLKKNNQLKSNNVTCYNDGITVSTTNRENEFDVYYCSTYDRTKNHTIV